MIHHYSSVKVLTPAQEQGLLRNCQHPRNRLIVLLMLDAGLRESEVVHLRIGHMDVQNNWVAVRSLKKRDRTKEVFRYIPFTQRLLDAFADYLPTLDRPTKDDFLFPPGKGSSADHLNRKQVWRIVKRLSHGQAYPHMLRHTFATRLRSKGCSIDTAQKLLGHSDRKTTEIYWHIPKQELKAAIQSIDPQRRRWWLRLYRKFFPHRWTPLTAHRSSALPPSVGRQEEQGLLQELGDKKVNLILLGPQGIGKTHLLDRYNKGKIIRIDEMRSAKKLLAGMLLEIYKEKENMAQILHPNAVETPEKLGTIINKQSVKYLSEELIKVTTKGEYTLIIDDVSRITPLGISALEKLKNHFHIFCAAREVPFSKASFLSNFQRLSLQPLPRSAAIELILALSKPFHPRIEDVELFKNHIYENTGGNPLFLIEMVERYAKEAELSNTTIRSFKHNLALKEIDLSLPVVLLISSLMVLRYIAGEFGDDSGAFRFFGGVFLVFAIFARSLLRFGKRRKL